MADKYISFEEKVEMIRLGNKATDKDFYDYVSTIIDRFDVQAFSMFINLISLLPEEMGKHLDFYRDNYKYLSNAGAMRLPFRDGMRYALLEEICEEVFGFSRFPVTLTGSDSERYSCFNCDSLGNGMYKPHDGETRWYIGHLDGQAHYACEDCKDALHDANPVEQ